MFVFSSGLGCHLGLDGSFAIMGCGCEIRFQRWAVICMYANDYLVTGWFRYCLMVKGADSGSGAKHNVSEEGKLECVF